MLKESGCERERVGVSYSKSEAERVWEREWERKERERERE